jgi:uncharacterized protein (DUF4415 family)
MQKKNDTVRYTAKQIKAKIARGEDRTNWNKIDAATVAKRRASIRADVDDVPGEPDWTQAVLGIPAPKDHINIRLDHDVLQWFRANGKGYQTLINNVLRAFVITRQQRRNTKSRSQSPSSCLFKRRSQFYSLPNIVPVPTSTQSDPPVQKPLGVVLST